MRPKKSEPKTRPPASLLPGAEAAAGIAVDELAAFYVLDSVKQFGPQKFKQLHQQALRPSDIVADPSRLSIPGKRGEGFRAQLAEVAQSKRSECRERAIRQINTAARLGAAIVSYDSPHYPRPVYESNNPVPVLYVRGAPDVLKAELTVACVGSRRIRPPYTELHETFARAACTAGFAIASGFALGADTIGHKAARAVSGKTICCMPGGLDRPFPPESKDLWDDLLLYRGAVFVSEFPFGTGASSLTLRKRNKLIVAFAQGVLISQTADTGGAMNAYRFAIEQRKPVATFLSDGTADTSGNKSIAEKRRESDAVFPLSSDQQEFERWLRRLSSST